MERETKKHKLNEKQIPKDCISFIIKYLEPLEFLKIALVSKEFYEEIKLHHPIYYSVIEYCKNSFFNTENNDNKKLYSLYT